uniref:Uncharacterized protein n=1 Tax=Conchiformibius kuhniae TaxID=211502 RepID=A0A8T9MT58_9NEIS|nr:hypothetical protein LVJ77_09150 [Conchiformibius kuhniae]
MQTAEPPSLPVGGKPVPVSVRTDAPTAHQACPVKRTARAFTGLARIGHRVADNADAFSVSQCDYTAKVLLPQSKNALDCGVFVPADVQVCALWCGNTTPLRRAGVIFLTLIWFQCIDK